MLPPSAWIPNGAKPFGSFGSLKPPAVDDGLERRVEDVDAAVVEVGRVQPVVRDREALVDRAARRAVGADDGGRAVHGRRPAEDRAGLGREEEPRGAALAVLADDEVGRVAVEDGAGRPARHGDGQRCFAPAPL